MLENIIMSKERKTNKVSILLLTLNDGKYFNVRDLKEINVENHF